MKKYTNYCLLLASASLLFLSCDNKLDLDPEQSLPKETALGTYAALETALYGMYDGFQDLNYYGRDFPVMADANSDDIVITADNSARFLFDQSFGYSSEYAFSRDFFIEAYDVIARANNIINSFENVADGEEADRNQVLGEALFGRALAHFDLVRRFAQPYIVDGGATLGVPYVEITEIGTPPRNTVAEVYAKIIADLERAAELMNQDLGPFRATQRAAQALLSRVYLYKGDNQMAIGTATAAMEGMDLVPGGNYIADWQSDGSPESILELNFQADENRGADNYGSIYNAQPNGYGDLRPSEDLMNLFSEDDVRGQFVYFLEDEDDHFLNKFASQVGGIPGLISPRIIRLAEVILNRAEAYAKSGDPAAALDDLNRIRTRAGLSALTISDVPDAEILLNEILEERRRELCFEGHRFYDLMRNGRDLVREDCGSIASTNNACQLEFGSPKVAYPIPQREIDANPNMEQNPGY